MITWTEPNRRSIINSSNSTTFYQVSIGSQKDAYSTSAATPFIFSLLFPKEPIRADRTFLLMNKRALGSQSTAWFHILAWRQEATRDVWTVMHKLTTSLQPTKLWGSSAGPLFYKLLLEKACCNIYSIHIWLSFS